MSWKAESTAEMPAFEPFIEKATRGASPAQGERKVDSALAMALALNRENYLLHKLHSLTGVIPVGYYMAQHLVLNSYSLAGPEKFNGVISFFEGIPKYVLFSLELVAIWIPLLFHSVYGLFITGRAKQNFIGEKYGWSQNRMYTLQRVSGIFIFFFLCIHVATTTGMKYLHNDAHGLEYAAWQSKLTGFGYAWLIFYMLGVMASSYHLGYGIWNFCIRWGITISDRAQQQVQKLSAAVFVLLTVIGWGALFGFLIHKAEPTTQTVMAGHSAHYASLDP